MIEVVWEFIVAEEALGRFELVFGPGGAWSQLVAHSPGFRGTTLLRDAHSPRRYLAVDVWDSEAQRAEMQAAQGAAHTALGDSLRGMCESMRELGVFSVRAQGAVRPAVAPRGAKGRASARAGRGAAR